VVDALADFADPAKLNPPRVAALGVDPVSSIPPAPADMQAFSTYDSGATAVEATPRPVIAPTATAPAEPPAPPQTQVPASAPPTPPAPPRRDEPTSMAEAITPSPPATVARVGVPLLAVFASPTDHAAMFGLYGTTEWGNPRVLLTTQLRGDWIQVLLPVRPNNIVGWVRARDVTLSQVADAIDVDLGARTLTWTRAGTVLLQATVAIGAPATPTPVGHFFVTDTVPETAGGPYGAWAIALNSYSETLATFDGGDPRIAIHGTNDPSSIGLAASNGCVRVGADALAILAAGVPQGTPVTIR